MPLSNGDTGRVQQSARPRRTTSNKVVPAIPLPLSRPRAAKQIETRASVGRVGEGIGPVASNGGAQNVFIADEKQPTVPVVDDEQRHVPEEPSALNPDREDEGTGEQEQVKTAFVDTPESRDSTTMSLSFGATPEPASGKDVPTTGEADASSPTVIMSPTHARKPVDRFDMRHIRTELPPAFIPSTEQYTPQSATSQGRTHQPALSHAHPIHPSVSSIVFGGYESASSSPAPPPNTNSAFPPPPPHHSNQPPFFGHGHHASEPQMQRTYQPTYPQQPMFLPHMRQGYVPQASQQYHHPHAHMPFRYPPREAFTPSAAQPSNGYGPRSRTDSQASSAAQDPNKIGTDVQSPIGPDHYADSAKGFFSDPRSNFPGPPRMTHPHQQQVPPPPPGFSNAEMSVGFENAESLRAHTVSQFNNSELADCHLQILEEHGYSRQVVDCHKLVLARSSTLISLIRQSEATSSVGLKTRVDIQLKGKYVRVSPTMDVIRYLYGGPLPSLQLYNPSSPGAWSSERMETALQYIATSAWLNVAAIANHAVEVATSLLTWDNMSLALAFALTGGIGPMWPIDDGMEERVSSCSSDDSFNKPEAGGMPAYGPYSTGLLHRVIDFIVQQLPFNFYLDSAAPQLESCPRLPTIPSRHESKPSRSDPRLTQIRFGEVPVEENHQRPSFTSTAVSSVLLSLPFPLLKFLLEHPALSHRLGPETVASIMRQVVNEREARRQKSLDARVIGNPDGGRDGVLVQNLYWEEYVESSSQHRAGYRLTRKRRGIDTPPSGAESERIQ